jgi:hypothetical protein
MLVWGGWKGTVRLDTGGAYVALPPGASSPGEAGALSVSPAPDGVSLDLAWEPSCTGEATDYEVMEGTIGAWTSHEPVLCSTGGATAARIVPSPGPHYYLVVPRTADAEGSYGADSAGLERPRSSNACVAAQVPATCP